MCSWEKDETAEETLVDALQLWKESINTVQSRSEGTKSFHSWHY